MVFYKTVFAVLCFISFGIALASDNPKFFALALLFGAACITAKRKEWQDPEWFVNFVNRNLDK